MSVVSHGHRLLLDTMLRQLAAFEECRRSHIIVTLNIALEAFDAASHPELRLTVVRNPTPKGFGANHNAAFRLCTTPWFVVLNPDLGFEAGNPFPSLLRTAQAIERVGAVASRIVGPSGATEDSVRANLSPWSLIRRAQGRRTALQARLPARRGAPFYWLAGMFLLLDSEAYRRVGGFDEGYFLYGEDYDLCARLYLAGYALAVDHGSAVKHEARRDSHSSSRHLRWHLASLARVWRSSVFWRIALGTRNDRPSVV